MYYVVACSSELTASHNTANSDTNPVEDESPIDESKLESIMPRVRLLEPVKKDKTQSLKLKVELKWLKLMNQHSQPCSMMESLVHVPTESMMMKNG